PPATATTAGARRTGGPPLGPQSVAAWTTAPGSRGALIRLVTVGSRWVPTACRQPIGWPSSGEASTWWSSPWRGHRSPSSGGTAGGVVGDWGGAWPRWGAAPRGGGGGGGPGGNCLRGREGPGPPKKERASARAPPRGIGLPELLELVAIADRVHALPEVVVA